MSSITSARTRPAPTSARRVPRTAWTGIAFPVLFAGSVVASSPPADGASNTKWIANYTGHGHDAQHLTTAILLVLSGLCLAAFLTALWQRVNEADTSRTISPFPVVAAAVSAAAIASGGVVMGYISGGELIGKYPLPSPDLLRLSNDLGFGLVSMAGMLSAALSIVCISVQGRAAGIVGNKTYAFGIVTAVALVFAVMFIPVLALLLWAPIVAIQWLRAAPPTDALGTATPGEASAGRSTSGGE